jgi:hypothetical protein
MDFEHLLTIVDDDGRERGVAFGARLKYEFQPAADARVLAHPLLLVVDFNKANDGLRHYQPISQPSELIDLSFTIGAAPGVASSGSGGRPSLITEVPARTVGFRNKAE